MNRRNFIKTSALAATLAGISPSLMANSTMPKGKKKIIFILRGVAYADAFNAFQKFSISSDLNFHIQKTTCLNASYSHHEGIENLLKGLSCKTDIIETQLLDRYTIPQVVEDAFMDDKSKEQIIYLHHTEIGHSSNKIYLEKLDEFFTELGKKIKTADHKIIVTADIGRNEKSNSCGGRDHSNSTSLETFALFIGGKASKLAAKDITLTQADVFKQKF